MQFSKVTYALVAAGWSAAWPRSTTRSTPRRSPPRRGHAAVRASSRRPSAGGTPLANLPDFTALVERTGVAVVNISVVHAKGKGGVDADDSTRTAPYYEFFKRFGGVPNGPGMRPPCRRCRNSRRRAWARASS